MKMARFVLAGRLQHSANTCGDALDVRRRDDRVGLDARTTGQYSRDDDRDPRAARAADLDVVPFNVAALSAAPALVVASGRPPSTRCLRHSRRSLRPRCPGCRPAHSPPPGCSRCRGRMPRMVPAPPVRTDPWKMAPAPPATPGFVPFVAERPAPPSPPPAPMFAPACPPWRRPSSRSPRRRRRCPCCPCRRPTWRRSLRAPCPPTVPPFSEEPVAEPRERVGDTGAAAVGAWSTLARRPRKSLPSDGDGFRRAENRRRPCALRGLSAVAPRQLRLCEPRTGSAFDAWIRLGLAWADEDGVDACWRLVAASST